MAIVAQVSGVAHEPLVIFYSQHMHVQKTVFLQSISFTFSLSMLNECKEQTSTYLKHVMYSNNDFVEGKMY